MDKRFRWAAGLLLAASFGISGCGEESGDSSPTTPGPEDTAARAEAFPFSYESARLRETGPAVCAKCHAEEVEQWERSHHARANRPVSPELDRAAFTPPREIEESGVTYRMEMEGDQFFLKVIDEVGSEQAHELVGVIGYTPLRQYLARFEGDKFQAISASYDVVKDRWVDVFAGEQRVPGEWGHWSGQGMNWNANCAYCHTTEYAKGFDFAADRYESRWVQQGIACAECHAGLEAHLQATRSGGPLSLPPLNRDQVEANCATCHSRRDQLTADAYQLGDAYHDHFSLSLPDQPGLYHPDGQILDEVFVHASFEMSRMHHAGVSCIDCHDPHHLGNILPIENNMLCMRCHESGEMAAPIIQPVAHSFHKEGSAGNQCAQCHMRKTSYMQVDPRADHGFHSPDPLLTKELGIPNSCNNCHSDQSVDWAIKHAEAWYGEKLAKSRQRQRARTIHAAYNYEPAALPQLIDLLADEDIPAWRATYVGLIRNYLPDERAADALRPLIDDESPMVRERVKSALIPLDQSGQLAMDALSDTSRAVRIAAARALESTNARIPHPQAAEEWDAYLEFNKDRPQSLLLLANRAAREQNQRALRNYIDRGIALDQANAAMYHQAAILLSMGGFPEEARSRLFTGWELAPQNAVFPYSLGLLAAESGELDSAIGYLEEAVALEPGFSRAWYNLSLAYLKNKQPEAAERAMRRAQGTAGNEQ